MVHEGFGSLLWTWRNSGLFQLHHPFVRKKYTSLPETSVSHKPQVFLLIEVQPCLQEIPSPDAACLQEEFQEDAGDGIYTGKWL